MRQLIGTIITAVAPRIEKVVPRIRDTLGGESAVLGILLLIKLPDTILGCIVEQTGNSCQILALVSEIRPLAHAEQFLTKPRDRLSVAYQTALALAHSRMELAGRTCADSPEIVGNDTVEVIAHE